METTNILLNFLAWLVGAGGAAIAASKLAGMIPAFANLESGTKKLVMWITSAVIGVGAWAIMTFVPKETLDAIAPVFAILASISIPYFANQTYYTVTRSIGIAKATELMLARRETTGVMSVMADVGNPVAKDQFKKMTIADFHAWIESQNKKGVISKLQYKKLRDLYKQLESMGMPFFILDPLDWHK